MSVIQFPRKVAPVSDEDNLVFDHRGFARRLRETRIALGLSEQQAAQQAERTVETWITYETLGRGRITGALVALAQHHKGRINWAWLFDGAGLGPLNN